MGRRGATLHLGGVHPLPRSFGKRAPKFAVTAKGECWCTKNQESKKCTKCLMEGAQIRSVPSSFQARFRPFGNDQELICSFLAEIKSARCGHARQTPVQRVHRGMKPDTLIEMRTDLNATCHTPMNASDVR